MTTLSGLWSRFTGLWQTGQAPVPQGDAFSSAGGIYNNAGLIDVFRGDADAAFRVSAFLCAARVLAEGVAQIPGGVRRETLRADGARSFEWRIDDPRHHLLFVHPNEVMTPFEFREMMVLHAVVRGTGRALVLHDSRGVPVELWPLLPGWCTVHRGQFSAQRYTIRIDGKIIRPNRADGEDTWRREDIIELRGPSWFTWETMDIARLAAGALGLAMDLERGASKSAQRSGRSTGFISTELALSDEARATLSESFPKALEEGRAPILDAAAKYHQMSMSAEQRQELDTRKFQIEEIARATRVNPIKLMAIDAASTNATASEMAVAHVTDSLMPWIERFEQAAALTLFSDRERRDGLRVHLDPKGLMRGSHADRAEYNTRALGNGNNGLGWMRINEVRESEGLNPLSQEEIDAMRAWAAPPASGKE